MVSKHQSAEATLGVRDEVQRAFSLDSTLVFFYLGNHLIGVVDTAIVGRLGDIYLGAVGIGNGINLSVIVLGTGMMLGLDPLVSQAVGAGEPRGARQLFWQGIWMSLLVSVPVIAVLFSISATLPQIGLAAEIASHTSTYLRSLLPGVMPLLMSLAGRSYLQSHSMTRPLIIGVAITNVVNVPVTWLLVFGDDGLTSLGLPGVGLSAFGVMGAGIGSSVCRGVQCLVVILAIRKVDVPGGAIPRRPNRSTLVRAARLGSPIGLMLLAEVGVFALASLLAGYLGSQALAAHYVTHTISSTAFQITLAISAATSVRVGLGVGRADPTGTRLAGLTGFGLGGIVMLTTGTICMLFPDKLAGLISNEAHVIEAAVPLLRVAAAFQLVDGMQVVGAGALRGAGDTRFPLAVNLVGHYLVGLPLGVALAFWWTFGALGLWWGLCTGLSVIAVALLIRFLYISSRPIERQ